MSNYNELRLTYQGGRQETITLTGNTIGYGEYQEQNIVAVEVPEIVQTIDSYAFCDNNDLANIVLNEGLQRIEGQAFQHGVYTAVTIPSTVTYIGFNSFNTSVEQGQDQHTFTITCLATTPPTLDDPEGLTFGVPQYLSAIYVPDGSVSAYQEAWSDYALKIQGGAAPAPTDDILTNLNIKAAYVGDDEVVKMYLGNDVVWEPELDPCEEYEEGTQERCECEGRYWWGGECHDEPEDPCDMYDEGTLEKCECQGKYWWGGECHDEPEPEPVYSAMPLTFKVLTAGTIVFGKKTSTAATADTCVFTPVLNGVEIAELNPATGGRNWQTTGTDSYTVNVQAGDIFEIYGVPNGIQVLGKGNGTLSNTSYHTFSGSTAEVEVYGNIMSMCVSPQNIIQNNFTTWAAAWNWGAGSNTGSTDYIVTSLFRGMPGLVSAENLWFPDDVPAYGYENLFKETGLITAPKVLPSITIYNGSYASMFDTCTALTGSPIIKAETIANKFGLAQANKQFYRMFYNNSNLNQITCFIDQTNMDSTQRTNYFDGWVTGVASTGNFYKKEGTGWYTGTNGFPNGWTMNVYQE